ncbi:MAG: DNA gyrase subunit B, partial [Sedimentisphaerales bacterium]
KEEQEEEEQIDAEELHEVGRINELVKKLKAGFGLDLRDYLLKQERAVSGEAMATKFQLANGGETFDVASLGEISTSIRKIGSEGVEIKRFKGLGEMNAEQLWETTMNPATRTLLSIKLDDAGEADRLFSILMGEDVEQRRDFIRDHALEVQFLDI